MLDRVSPLLQVAGLRFSPILLLLHLDASPNERQPYYEAEDDGLYSEASPLVPHTKELAQEDDHDKRAYHDLDSGETLQKSVDVSADVVHGRQYGGEHDGRELPHFVNIEHLII